MWWGKTPALKPLLNGLKKIKKGLKYMKRPNKILNMSHLRQQTWVVSWAWLPRMPSLLLLAPLPSLAGEEEWESAAPPEWLGCPEDPTVTHFCQDYLWLLELLILTVMRLEVLPHPTKQVHLELSRPQHNKQQPIPIISMSRENTGTGCTQHAGIPLENHSPQDDLKWTVDPKSSSGETQNAAFLWTI